MVEDNSANERTLKMEEVDKVIASPSDRTKLIYAKFKEVLPEASTWDLICFCSEYLGTQVSAQPYLQDAVKDILMLVYTMHYEFPWLVDDKYPAPATENESNSSNGTQEASISETRNDSGTIN